MNGLSSHHQYERGESQPTLESLAALADYFHVSVDYLIGRAAGG
ncbi:helix-turn-helix transcriptional regulator [Acutalibacter sp. JLR.KK004]